MWESIIDTHSISVQHGKVKVNTIIIFNTATYNLVEVIWSPDNHSENECTLRNDGNGVTFHYSVDVLFTICKVHVLIFIISR